VPGAVIVGDGETSARVLGQRRLGMERQSVDLSGEGDPVALAWTRLQSSAKPALELLTPCPRVSLPVASATSMRSRIQSLSSRERFRAAGTSCRSTIEPIMRPQIAVIGAARAVPEVQALAEGVGRLLGERGCTVVCGGLGGVMEAVAKGAREAGGAAIGLLPGESRQAGNAWLEHAIATGMGEARDLAVVASGDAVIAVGGGWGTLAEIGLARKLGREVVLLATELQVSGDGLHRCSTAEEAVTLALALAGPQQAP
jgi:uncharacterized protein (TIGR00725 family)